MAYKATIQPGGGKDNIAAVLDLADAIDNREGRLAYWRYHDLLKGIAAYYDVTFEQAVAVFAATSPNNDYIKNLRSTVSLLAGFKSGKPLSQIAVSTYKACAERAWRVLKGENFLDFTKGKKTRSFYMNITEPGNPDYVTIDSHMISIYAGRYMIMKEAVRFLKSYEAIADSVKEVARERGLIANQVQAVNWFTWKRIHKPVKGDGQMQLFCPDDNWQTVWNAVDIKPFTFKEKQYEQLRLALTNQPILNLYA